jgi:beta-phosphoglucomutase
MPDNRLSVIFDLDGVLADTAELHYRSWQRLATRLGIPFDRSVNDRMRGVSRPESLAILLRGHETRFSAADQEGFLVEKNDAYLELVNQMTPADLLPGARPLLEALRAAGARISLASSSRNAAPVLERLGVAVLFDAVVDANTAARSKPDPQVFLLAAERLGVSPAGCVVIEDGAVGVAAARAAGMRVIGIGPAERLTGADRVVATMAEIDVALIAAVAAERGADL